MTLRSIERSSQTREQSLAECFEVADRSQLLVAVRRGRELHVVSELGQPRHRSHLPDFEHPVGLAASGQLLYDGLTITFENEDGDDVNTPPIILKLGEFAFTPYLERS